MSADPAGEAENKYCPSPGSDPDVVGTSLFILMKRNSIFRPDFVGITFLTLRKIRLRNKIKVVTFMVFIPPHHI
jgi:hypothetical protein